MKYYLYILKSEIAEKFYTGISKNPQTRLEYHNTLERGFTSRYRPWNIVFTKEYSSKAEAANKERKIKSWKSSKSCREIFLIPFPKIRWFSYA